MRVLSHWRRQLQKNNKGSALVNVLLLVSLMVLLTTGILTLVMYNYHMKTNQIKATENFYDAEAAMEEIRIGLVKETSKAAAVAYTQTLEHYDVWNQEQKEKNFQKLFRQELQQALLLQQGQLWYDIELLDGYLEETKWDGATGAKLITSQGENALNVESQGLVLKNVSICYVDQEAFETTITTDICLNYPPITFAEADAMSNLLCYALVAQEGYQQTTGGHSTVTGNAYLGKEAYLQGGSLTLQGLDGSKGYVIIPGDMIGDAAAKVQTNHMELWAKNFVLNQSSIFSVIDSSVYLQEDLVINKNAKFTMSGQLYTFGNEQVFPEENEAKASSGILLNGANATLDLRQLQQLVLSGVSYIQGQQHQIPTGQSIMTKGDQKAYLIPGEVIGAGYENGGANPIPASQWDKLLQEIKKAKGYASIDDIAPADVIDFKKQVGKIGGSLESIHADEGFDIMGIQVPGMGTMYYFFMKFSSQEQRNAFASNYYANTLGYHQLQDNLSYYAGGGVSLPADTKDTFSFYFQGNVIASDNARLLVKDHLSAADNTEEKQQERFKEMKEQYQRFFALEKKLKKESRDLKEQEKNQEIFQNLVHTKKITREHWFETAEGSGALITDGDVIIDNSKKKAGLQLVIAKGDVKVERDFQGLILSGKRVTVASGCDITADARAVALLCQYVDQEGDSPSQYIKQVENYLVGGNVKSQQEEGALALTEQVCYSNWKKR